MDISIVFAMVENLIRVFLALVRHQECVKVELMMETTLMVVGVGCGVKWTSA